MHEWQSLSHVRWDCKYHVVIIPKYRRKVFRSSCFSGGYNPEFAATLFAESTYMW